MQTEIKTKEIRDLLAGSVDTVSQKEGLFTARRSFFYPHGMTAEKFAATIRSLIGPGCQILESQEIWKPFRGGATVAQGSHWVVRFRVQYIGQL